MTRKIFSAEERSYEDFPCAAKFYHLLWTIVANLAGRLVRKRMLGVATRKIQLLNQAAHSPNLISNRMS
jgi:hypothetical protein